MTSTDRPPAYFVSDAVSVDFLNTYSMTNEVVFEWISDGSDLLEWLAATNLVPREVLEDLRAHALPGEMDAIAAQARVLREWFRSFVKKWLGKSLSPRALASLEPLNRILARDVKFGQIAARSRRDGQEASSTFSWSAQRRWQSADTLLFPLAEAMANLVCNDDFAHVRMCEGAGCNLLFVDRTRHRNRRWCSMALCGNRAKQVAHRNRRQRDV